MKGMVHVMYHFIINPHSRSGKGFKVWKLIEENLIQKNIPYEAHLTHHAFDATQIANTICVSNPGQKEIIAVGGDGTINEVINGLTDFDEVLLGYIPSGSSNDLARSLKLPKDPLECLEQILSPTNYKYVDIGNVTMKDTEESRKFAVSCGTGFDAAICKETLHSKIKPTLNKLGLGKFTYIIIALKQLLFAPFLDGNVTVDGRNTNTYNKILMITSMIHKFEGGGMKIVPYADPTDRKLSVCIVSGLSRIQVLFLLPTLLFGKHINFKGVKTFNCETLEIKTLSPANIHVDGEYPGSFKHFKITCSPKQIRIVN